MLVCSIVPETGDKPVPSAGFAGEKPTNKFSFLKSPSFKLLACW